MASGAAICMSVEAPRAEADDAGAGHRDQRGVQMPARPESSHVQVDERRHDEGESGGRQARAPVVDAEVLKQEHRAPVVERGLLQPGMAVEIGRDAGAQAALEGVRRVEADQHLMRDLRIARLVGAHQAQAVAAQNRRKSIEKKEDGEGQKNRRLRRWWPSGAAASASACGDRKRTVPADFHLQQFSKYRSGHQHALPDESRFAQDGWGLWGLLAITRRGRSRRRLAAFRQGQG